MTDTSRIILAALALAASQATQALPVIPGASGFGMDTRAGRGGTVYRVTNLNERGSGSLGACVAASGPRVCVFEVSGTIRLNNDLVIYNDRITIAGQTAPSPGIMLRGAALRIQGSDVLVQHLRVRVGDDPSGPPAYNRDALKIEGNASKVVRNVVIDHCSFSWAVDETATAWEFWDNITYRSNIFAEPLRESINPNPGTSDSPGVGYGVLFGPNDGNASMMGNLLAHAVARNPLSFASRMVFVNNVVYDRANMDMALQTQNNRVTFTSVVGNVFLRGPDYTRTQSPVRVYTDDAVGLMPGSQLYVRDNAAQEANSDPWSVVSFEGPGIARNQLQASSAPAWPAGLIARTTANQNVYEYVLDGAGARPTDRDSVDQRIVQNVRNRSGQIINCVSADGSARCQRNAGGWPQYPVKTRALTLPANPSSVTASGYTNLELWLHAMSAELEGVDPNKAPSAPSQLRVQ